MYADVSTCVSFRINCSQSKYKELDGSKTGRWGFSKELKIIFGDYTNKLLNLHIT